MDPLELTSPLPPLVLVRCAVCLLRHRATLVMQHLQLNTGDFGAHGAQGGTADAYGAAATAAAAVAAATAAAQQQQQQAYLYARQRADPGRDVRSDAYAGAATQLSPRGGPYVHRLSNGGNARVARAPQPRASYPGPRSHGPDNARAARLSQPNLQSASMPASSQVWATAGLHSGPPSAPGPGAYATQQQQQQLPSAAPTAGGVWGLPVIRRSRHAGAGAGGGSGRAQRYVTSPALTPLWPRFPPREVALTRCCLVVCHAFVPALHAPPPAAHLGSCEPPDSRPPTPLGRHFWGPSRART